MSLAAGSRFGAYDIASLIGSGGMGEVYRARDTRLGRDVALKILPATFTHDPERVARFKREAQVLAALNHPNIAGIYGLDEAEGQQFLTMELVDGETLAQRIARGPAVDDALAIARQITDALEAAHDKGIIHRDLKPANIALTADGQAKILDFGLAKALEPNVASDLSMSPTLTFAATQAGVILGTAAYMAPEQAKGRGADKRSDVWAFGCVLYEMLTGTRAFEGEDVSDTLAAVLRGEPDWKRLPKDVSPQIELLLRRCLEKDRKRRIGDVSTIRFLLDEALPAPPPATVPQSPSPRWKWIGPAVGLAVVAAALGALAAWRAKPAAPPPIVTRFSVALGEGQNFTNTGELFLALSPDGSRIVYVANRRLYLRSMSDLEAQPIRGTESNVRRPMFSPDGASIAFFSADDRALKRVAVTGGAPVTITTSDSPNAPFGGSWSGDTILYGLFGGPSHGIVRVPASGGKPEVIVKVNADEMADGPQLLPDGDHVLFSLSRPVDGADRWNKARIVVQSLRTGQRKTLIEGGSDARYLPTGHIIYALGGVVFAVRFDERNVQVVGGPVPVVEGVRRAAGGTTVNTGAAQLSIARNGSLAFVPGPISTGSGQQILAMLDRNGNADPLKLAPGAYRNPRISPDGKQMAIGTDDGNEAAVWVYDVAGTTAMRRLTLGGKNRYPVWSPDGQRIAFQSDREGDAAIFWQRADGSGAAERLTKPEPGVTHVPESWSPDGKHLLLSAAKDSLVTSQLLSLEDHKTTAFGNIQSRLPINAAFSPDGRWVAYTVSLSGSSILQSLPTLGGAQIFVQPFPATGATYPITKTNGHHPFWSRNGEELYYIPGPGQFAVIKVSMRQSFTFTDPTPLPRGQLGFVEGGPANVRQNDAAPDQRVVAVIASATSGPVSAPQFQVVLNWFEELKARVPTR